MPQVLHIISTTHVLHSQEPLLNKIFFTNAGKLHEAKGFLTEALGAYSRALDIESKHVPSMISAAVVLGQRGGRSLPAARCFLADALRLERTSHVAWFNLGLTYKDEEGRSAALEAAECFQAAALLEETAPAESFR